MKDVVKLALIGENISYSLSPIIQKAIFTELNIPLSYELLSFSEVEFKSKIPILKRLDGFSVTKPHKQSVLKFLAYCSYSSVNTVKAENGKLLGFNTDGYGFFKSFLESYGSPKNKQVLVLGAGGVSYPVCLELVKAGAKTAILNRTIEKATTLALSTGAVVFSGEVPEIIINCTTLGLNGENSLPETVDTSKLEFAYDTIYSPPETELLKAAKALGAKTENGLSMLIYQAIKADEIFLNLTFSKNETEKLFTAAKNAVLNKGENL